MKTSKKAHKITFFVVFLLIAALVYTAMFGISSYYGDKKNVIIKSAKDIRWGTDIRGGVEAVFTPAKGVKIKAKNLKKDMAAAKSIIETRLVNKNITDYEVYTDIDNRQVIVRFPWTADESDFDPSTAVKELGETALLTFNMGQTQEGQQSTGNVILSAEDGDFDYAEQGWDNEDNVVVNLHFTSQGRRKFSNATASVVNSSDNHISICLDGACISSPSVSQRIDQKECYITGNFDVNSATDLANKINAGNLPFELTIDDSKLQVISPTLGNEALNVMLFAGALAMIVVCLLMIIRYRLPGVIATIALIGQIAGVIASTSGYFKDADSFTLTIPGIAGIILSIGIGVDANVIAFERIRDEFKNGKTIDGAIASGFNNSLSSIIDGNITVIIVSIVLMGAFGTPESFLAKIFKPLLFMFSTSISGTIYSFGYTLLIGVIFNFIMAVCATRLMLKSISRFKCLRKPWLYGGKAAPKATKEGE